MITKDSTLEFDIQEGHFVVLYVDDDDLILTVIREFFSQYYPNIVFFSAHSAYEAIFQLGVQHFDVIITDYVMPGMDGLQLVQHLRRSGNTIPIIMVSGETHPSVATRAIYAGVNCYMSKTYSVRQLCQELEATIRQVARRTPPSHVLRVYSREFDRIVVEEGQTKNLETMLNTAACLLHPNGPATFSYVQLPKENYGIAETTDLFWGVAIFSQTTPLALARAHLVAKLRTVEQQRKENSNSTIS